MTSVTVLGALAFSAQASDMVQIKGEACEKFVSGQSKSSIRVRVTDKASYNAVSQVQNLADVRSKMLEHDFNVIVYNLVDNYVQDLMVRTVSQNDDELCVKVTGEIPVDDINKVVTNYSPNAPAPEYDIKELAGVEEEVLTKEDDLISEKPKEPEAEVLYNGSEEEAKAKAETTSAVEVYSENTQTWQTSQEKMEEGNVLGEGEDEETFELGELPPPPVQQQEQSVVEQVTETEEDLLSEDFLPDAPMIELPAKVYVGPVEFNNNTHSSKTSQVLKDMFADTVGYQLIYNRQ